MTDSKLKEGFAVDLVLLKYVGLNPVVVHGGGPQIDKMLERLNLVPKFRQGVRVTDRQTLDVVEMVLGGMINKEIVNLLNQHGGKGVGLTGKDAGLIRAKPLTAKSWAASVYTELEGDGDEGFGHVGEVESIDPHLLLKLQDEQFIPVIAPLGTDKAGHTYNINADLVAGAVAAALKAEKLLVLTDVKGIRNEKNRHVSTLSRKDMQRMVKKGTIKAGMLPKVHACLEALDGGVSKAHIIDGRMPHAVLLEVFTDKGIGTEIVS